jgi:hypothetical protein
MALELRIGDVVRMKKPHPCGNHLWQVRRLGADVGITCQKCRRHVMLPRSYLERRVKEVIPGGRPTDDAAGGSESQAWR